LKRGTIAENQNVIISKSDGELQKHKIKEIFVFEGLERKRVTSVQAGDICAITGIEGFEIGD
jgi:GTP-binding protein